MIVHLMSVSCSISLINTNKEPRANKTSSNILNPAQYLIMRKGFIQVDWIIAFFIFLIFLSWSYQYYATLFRSKSIPLDQAALGVNDIIMDNITNEVYDIPLSYNSPLQQSNSIMYAYYYWTSEGETNSTMVLSNTSSALACMISGNAVYWRSDVVAGQNNFTIRVSNRTAAVKNCSATLSTSNANITVPRAGDMKIMVSQAAIDALNAINYSQFKTNNLINRDFRLSFEVTGGSTTYYGSIPPNTSTIFSLEKWYTIEETNGKVRITSLIW